MMICPSRFEDSIEEKLSQEEELNQEIAIKERLTRKEKKAKYGFTSWRNRKLEKFEVPVKDTELIRRRKLKKCAKKADRYNYPKSFAKSEAIFNKWFAENKYRLNHKLIRTGTSSYKFEGVIKEVELLLSMGTAPEAEFAFTYYGDDRYKEDGCFDLGYIEYIGQEGYHPQKGYYDMDRVDEIYTYFPTREELYINEVFEKIITDCNSKLVTENSLYMFDHNAATSAYIDTTDESKAYMRMIRELRNKETIDGLSEKEYRKLIEDRKATRVFKYDLLDTDKKPEILYFKN